MADSSEHHHKTQDVGSRAVERFGPGLMKAHAEWKRQVLVDELAEASSVIVELVNERERMRPVVDAALAWRDIPGWTPTEASDPYAVGALAAAVDAYREATNG